MVKKMSQLWVIIMHFCSLFSISIPEPNDWHIAYHRDPSLKPIVNLRLEIQKTQTTSKTCFLTSSTSLHTGSQWRSVSQRFYGLSLSTHYKYTIYIEMCMYIHFLNSIIYIYYKYTIYIYYKYTIYIYIYISIIYIYILYHNIHV